MNESEISEEWKRQIAERITTAKQLEEYVELSEEERAAFDRDPVFSVTQHYAGLLKNSPLRKTVVPNLCETRIGPGELADPLGEENHRVTPHLIHTYPDKVLFLVTGFCSTICRYCTRSRLTLEGQPPCRPRTGQSPSLQFEKSLEYIAQHPEIRDVLVSGGDPLTLTDSVLDGILSRLRKILHVRMIRIGSKVPAVLPARITNELCAVLRKHRVWLSLHFIHADELTTETKSVCRKLSDHGISMISQTVLLKGVNDNAETLIGLFYGLLEINVKPYYLLQCDPVRGSEHFRTPVVQGIELIRSLHGNISGPAIPQYVIDAPGGGGKIPILSKEQIRRDGDEIVIKNSSGREFRYPDPEDGHK